MRIVTPEEMQALEARFMAETGVSSATLMGRAAEGLLRAAVELTGRSGPVPQETHRLAGLRAAAFCGPGANGGDGWALAKLYEHRIKNMELALKHARLARSLAENPDQPEWELRIR